MHKLTILKCLKAKTNYLSIRMDCEQVLGVIVAQADLIQEMMANPEFVFGLEEIGATHWELTEFTPKNGLAEFPENFYNITKYHEGE